MDSDLEIRKGWKYLIRSGRSDEITGTFKGYSMIGNETAVVMDSGSGTIRYIPVSKIQYITLLEKNDELQEDVKKEEPGVYYG